MPLAAITPADVSRRGFSGSSIGASKSHNGTYRPTRRPPARVTRLRRIREQSQGDKGNTPPAHTLRQETQYRQTSDTFARSPGLPTPVLETRLRLHYTPERFAPP